MLAHPAKPWFIHTDLDASERVWDQNEPAERFVPLAESQHHVINPTNPGRALDNGVEHRLHVGRRAADDAEHLGRCGLMLQGLAQFCVAFLDFFEQPTFSMAMTAWSAKVFSSAICLSVKGRTSVRRITIAPMATLRAATAWQAWSETLLCRMALTLRKLVLTLLERHGHESSLGRRSLGR